MRDGPPPAALSRCDNDAEEDEVVLRGEDLRLQREHGVVQTRAEDAEVGDARRAGEERVN